MKIVIEISEEDYKLIKSYGKGSTNYRISLNLYDAVKNGVPLPKHHGDLIDRRELKKEVYTTTEWNGDIHRIIYEASIDDANPIIKAEGSESE